jgi:hypothetical protein
MTAAMEPLPFVDDPMLTAAGLSAAAARPAMGYSSPGRGYVQVPVAMLTESAETVLIVSMLARRLRASSGGVVEGVLQTHLAHELGWISVDEAADQDPKHRASELRAAVNRVSRWIRAAASTSWMDVQYSHDARRQRTMARYRLLGRPSADNGVEYVEAPAELFDRVTSGALDKNLFLAWLRWRAMMGAATSTNRSVPQFAERWEVSEATARRHRKALLKAEALIEVAALGSPSITALPVSLVRRRNRVDGPVKNRESVPSGTVKSPSQESWPSVSPVVPKDISISPSAAADVQEVSRGTVTAASPNHDRDSRPADTHPMATPRRQASPSSLTAAGRLLPRFTPDLVSCAAHFRRGIIRRAALFLDDGYGPEAVVRAANELTVGITDGNHCDAFRQALASLASDVLAGACKGCGRYTSEDGHHSGCDQAGAVAATWFDQMTARDCCVLCEGPGTRREDLPIPVVVCDECWDRQNGPDPAEVCAPGPSSADSPDGGAEHQVGLPPTDPARRSSRRAHGGASCQVASPPGAGRLVPGGRTLGGACRRSAPGRGNPRLPARRLVRSELAASVERGRRRELARQGVP